MKKRSIIKLENFLFVHSATLGVGILVMVCGLAIPVISVIKTRKLRKKSSEKFADLLPLVYSKDIQELSDIPFQAYQEFKERGQKRLGQFDSKQK